MWSSEYGKLVHGITSTHRMYSNTTNHVQSVIEINIERERERESSVYASTRLSSALFALRNTGGARYPLSSAPSRGRSFQNFVRVDNVK